MTAAVTKTGLFRQGAAISVPLLRTPRVVSVPDFAALGISPTDQRFSQSSDRRVERMCMARRKVARCGGENVVFATLSEVRQMGPWPKHALVHRLIADANDGTQVAP
jgi:hypothetical protein